MAKAIVSDNKKRKPGRPATGIGTLVGVRWSDAELAELDAWRSRQADDIGRPAAIRALVQTALSKDR